MTRPRSLAIMLAVVFAALPAPVLAEVPPGAKPAFDKGVLAAQQQEWEVAFKSFMDAHRFFRGSPEINYNLGLTESKMPGRELRAVAWLAAYLAADPAAPNASAVKSEILGLLVKNEGNNDRFVEVARQAAEQVPEEAESPTKFVIHHREYDLSQIYLLYLAEGDEAKADSFATEAHLDAANLPTRPPNFGSEGIKGASVTDWVNELDDNYDGLNQHQFLDLSGYVASVTTPPSPAVLAELRTSAMDMSATVLTSTAFQLLAQRRRITAMLDVQFGATFVP